MTRLSLTDYLWKNINSVQFNVGLLEAFSFQTPDEAQKKVKTAIQNIKKRKRYNKRTMYPSICKIKKDFAEFLNTVDCKNYFTNYALISSINNEETEREIFKSSVRAVAYTKKTVGVKRQKIDQKYKGEEDNVDEEGKEDKQDNVNEEDKEGDEENDNVDITLEEEHEIAIYSSLGEDESFNSLADQEAKCGVLQYLTGDGQLAWSPTSSGSSILHKLMRFRNINVTGAQNLKILNDLRALSLSFIFVFGHSTSSNARLCEYLSLKDCSRFCKQVNIPPVAGVHSVVSDLLALQSAYNSSSHNLDEFYFAVKYTNGLISNIITNAYNCLYVWNTGNITECQFSEQVVFPLLLPLFNRHREFEISKYDKTMIAMEDYKPDLLIMLKLKFNVKVDFFICEIKKPGCSSNKYETDFVKVQREMKAIVDQQIDLGINDPICYGLLVEGYDCYLYKMSLEYEAEYRSHLVAQFRTLRDSLDIMLLLPAISVLSYLDEELTRLRVMLQNTTKSKRNQPVHKQYQRPSFKKPVKKE
ncbi:hypothetical protein PS15p_204594 [Mucor circinelloides]